jgi:hypothetical protein
MVVGGKATFRHCHGSLGQGQWNNQRVGEFFDVSEVFPLIGIDIEKASGRDRSFVDHDAIKSVLLKDH